MGLPVALPAAGLARHYRDVLGVQTPEERENCALVEYESRADRRGLCQGSGSQGTDMCRKGRGEQLPCRWSQRRQSGPAGRPLDV